MSLEELREQAEAEEENTEVEEPEAQDEPKSRSERLSELEKERDDNLAEDTDEGSSDEEEGDETEDSEPSDDCELDLDGEPEPGQQKPSPEEALVYKLTKQKAKAKGYKTELEELKAEVAALRSGNLQPQTQARPKQPTQPYPPVPVLYEDGIDTKEQYTQAYQRWMADCKAIDQRNAQADQQQTEYKRRMEELTHNMARRVSKFATEHKMGSDYVANAVDRARQEVEEATGIEGSLAFMLEAVGEGSEKAAIWIGTDKGARDLEQIKRLLAEDKTGLKAIAHLTRIASRKPSARRTSKAPAPDRPIKGDGAPASQRKLQEAYDKASSKSDLKAMREVLRKAEKVGVKLT